MRKNDFIEGTIEELRYPNKGIFWVEQDGSSPIEVIVKNALPGQTVLVRITKKRAARAEAALYKVLAPAPCEKKPSCAEFGSCGGCLFLSFPKEVERELKENEIRHLLQTVDPHVDSWFEGILDSPISEEYRNKMELSFGDQEKGGDLVLGMHKRGSFYDIADASSCQIVDSDCRTIIQKTGDFFAKEQVPFFHRKEKKGYLRHLLIREGKKTGEILVDVVTTNQTQTLSNGVVEEKLLKEYVQMLQGLSLKGKIVGILHTHNDSVADLVKDEGTDLLYGKGSYEEELLGLHFTVTPFSFFQTNSVGAELLYQTARAWIASDHVDLVSQNNRKPVIFDLYCGTGTISLLMAPTASKVVGVEIVPEAVQAAKENAVRNNITNCEFIEGDVLKVLDTLKEKPDLIILDPPRDGVHPKALPKILAYGVPSILYISCKPTSLVRDFPVIKDAGYHPVRGVAINQFPRTTQTELAVMFHREKGE